MLPDDIRDLTELEVDASIRWLWRFSTPEGPACGLVLDRDDQPGVATVAATGFALAAWCVGVERGVLDHDAVLDRLRGTVATLEHSVPHRSGFLAHFVDADMGQRTGRSEYSTIDTALALCGAVVAAGWSGDPEVTAAADRLLDRVDWPWLVQQRGDRTVLRMAWVASGGDDYGSAADDAGFVGAWDMTAEQLPMYLLAAGHPAVPEALARDLWRGGGSTSRSGRTAGTSASSNRPARCSPRTSRSRSTRSSGSATSPVGTGGRTLGR